MSAPPDAGIRCDFHIHTALSPCADMDMTPCNIVNMAVLAGLDAIAITDHNSAKNTAAVVAAAKNLSAPLIVVPGMEAESSEEIHTVCLFPDLGAAMAFDAWIEAGMSGIKNKPRIFGEQCLFNENDEKTGEYAPLLVTATRYGIAEIIKKAAELGGAAYPAHIDREHNGILAILGFIPPELPITRVEISKAHDPEGFVGGRPELMKYGRVTASDAHRLWEIGENPCLVPRCRAGGVRAIIDYLRGVLTCGTP